MSLLFKIIAKKYDRITNSMGLSNEKKLHSLIKDVRGMEVADIGGGTGTLAVMLQELGASVTIIDPCTSMTNIAKQKSVQIKVISAYAERIPAQDAVFDMVCMRDSLHHMEDQEAVLSEAMRILKPKGKVFIHEFNPRSIISKGLCLLERSLGENTKLMSGERLVKLLKGLSVDGELYCISRFEYVFVGGKRG